RPAWVALVDGARADPRGTRAARSVLRDRDTHRLRPTGAVQGVHETPAGRQHDRPAVQRGAVPDVVPQLAVPAAGPGPLAAASGAHLPANGADDHGGRLTGGA